MDTDKLLRDCKAVLKQNDRGGHTVPSGGMYPHQWLWDSCFIAIGLSHYKIERAKREIRSLLDGQWDNGMLPHMIFARDTAYEADRRMWHSQSAPASPHNRSTSGITQPPVVAEAIVAIGKRLSAAERRTWYKQVWPQLLAYHEWLFKERDPHSEGLVLQIHPHETGLDSTPPWTAQLREHHRPWWVGLIDVLRLERFINLIRRDTRQVPATQRMSNMDALLYWDVIRRLRRKRYDMDKILHRSLFVIEDLTFNSIFIRANGHLREIAQTIGIQIPGDLEVRIIRSIAALDQLWEPGTKSYYSRDFITHKLLPEQSIAALMPLYSGAISKDRAAQLVKQLKDTNSFWPAYPVPSVPINAPEFLPMMYWQGPAWINTNWLIIQGLKQYDFHDEARELTTKTLELVAQHGSYEYFNPLDGTPLGSPDFSWTAALTIDLLSQKPAHKS